MSDSHRAQGAAAATTRAQGAATATTRNVLSKPQAPAAATTVNGAVVAKRVGERNTLKPVTRAPLPRES